MQIKNLRLKNPQHGKTYKTNCVDSNSHHNIFYSILRITFNSNPVS